MKQIITAKLKIHFSQDQKESLGQLRLPYRDALNYSSGIGFETREVSSNYKLHKLFYSDIYDVRETFRILAKLSGNFSRKRVANFSKNQWHKLQKNQEFIKKIPNQKIFNKLDKTIILNSINCQLNYQRDFCFKTG